MTAPVRTATATEVVQAFFDAYRRHDVDAMVDLCTDDADFVYVPFEAWGKQRVLRGDGKVRTVGKTIWAGLIHAFPDLTNTVESISGNERGDVVAEVVIGGTQALPWANIAARGGRYDEPHLFWFTVTADGLIGSITAYWDNAGISRQLGHLEVD
ncbi:MAG: nuclear transport factor 2 family protein [Pseudonocardia sp.]